MTRSVDGIRLARPPQKAAGSVALTVLPDESLLKTGGCRSIGNAPPDRQIFFVTFNFTGWPPHEWDRATLRVSATLL